MYTVLLVWTFKDVFFFHVWFILQLLCSWPIISAQDVQFHGRGPVLCCCGQYPVGHLHCNRLLDAVPSLWKLCSPGFVEVLHVQQVLHADWQHRWDILVYLWNPWISSLINAADFKWKHRTDGSGEKFFIRINYGILRVCSRICKHGIHWILSISFQLTGMPPGPSWSCQGCPALQESSLASCLFHTSPPLKGSTAPLLQESCFLSPVSCMNFDLIDVSPQK